MTADDSREQEPFLDLVTLGDRLWTLPAADLAPLVARALAAADRETRVSAAGAPLWALARAAPSVALPLVRRALADSEGMVREVASMALRSFPDDPPEPRLTLIREALTNADPHVRLGAIWALPPLPATAPQECEPLLVTALGDRDRGVRAAGVEALRDLLPKNLLMARPLIERAARDRSFEVRQRLCEATMPALIAADPGLAATLLGELLIDRQKAVHRAALAAFRTLVDAGLAQAAPLFPLALGSYHWQERHGTVVRLERLAALDPAAADTLVARALADPSAQVRGAAARVRSALGAGRR